MTTTRIDKNAASIGKKDVRCRLQLLLDKSECVFKEVFKREITAEANGKDIYQFFQTPRVNNKLLALRKKILNAHQWKKLHPKSHIIDITSFDITLMFLLMQSICHLPPPKLGWFDSPDPRDRSLSANLLRVKIFRNKFSHGLLELSKDEYDEFWNGMTQTLLELGVTKEEIDDIKNIVLGKKLFRLLWRGKIVMAIGVLFCFLAVCSVYKFRNSGKTNAQIHITIRNLTRLEEIKSEFRELVEKTNKSSLKVLKNLQHSKKILKNASKINKANEKTALKRLEKIKKINEESGARGKSVEKLIEKFEKCRSMMLLLPDDYAFSATGETPSKTIKELIELQRAGLVKIYIPQNIEYFLENLYQLFMAEVEMTYHDFMSRYFFLGDQKVKCKCFTGIF